MDVSIYYTQVYENIRDWTLGENKPKQTQFYLPPGEPALLALRSFSEGGSAAEGGPRNDIFGSFPAKSGCPAWENRWHYELIGDKIV